LEVLASAWAIVLHIPDSALMSIAEAHRSTGYAHLASASGCYWAARPNTCHSITDAWLSLLRAPEGIESQEC
ncbi:hypothetical protein OFM35_34980, partial [Escherichia coli]|nr:hypothetical protein [Escherichia coli]